MPRSSSARRPWRPKSLRLEESCPRARAAHRRASCRAAADAHAPRVAAAGDRRRAAHAGRGHPDAGRQARRAACRRRERGGAACVGGRAGRGHSRGPGSRRSDSQRGDRSRGPARHRPERSDPSRADVRGRGAGLPRRSPGRSRADGAGRSGDAGCGCHRRRGTGSRGRGGRRRRSGQRGCAARSSLSRKRRRAVDDRRGSHHAAEGEDRSPRTGEHDGHRAVRRARAASCRS